MRGGLHVIVDGGLLQVTSGSGGGDRRSSCHVQAARNVIPPSPLGFAWSLLKTRIPSPADDEKKLRAQQFSQGWKRMAKELALDLEELKQLQCIAKRPQAFHGVCFRSVEDFIFNGVWHFSWLFIEFFLKKDANGASPAAAPQIPIPIATSAKAPVNPALSYVTLASFSWDQDNDKVKIYVSLERVEQEKIQANFKPMSFDVKFRDVKGKNYRCAIPKLNKEIEPEKCKVIVKPTRVIITLFKACKGNWSDLHYKEDKLKPNLDKERDPMAEIMNLMKNMYEEGDIVFLKLQKTCFWMFLFLV
ncbi:calcyclin-binding protein-like [Hibiscus syriacus]|uniref:calcyclin-binding protein-like n=1 Tax=Hibiscus syriacus TaxID=106335 RepID=UPI00192056DD|nr:calcyclin-binding protein-like [Hibiscus syriacus]